MTVTRVLSKRDISLPQASQIVLGWYDRARRMEHTHTLKKFLDSLIDDYNHSPETVVHAITAGMLAAGHVMNASAIGGITENQATGVMWEFIRGWMRYGSPLKLIDYSHMLYPQNEDLFSSTLTPSTMRYMRRRADEILEQTMQLPVGGGVFGDQAVRQHLKNISSGIAPFGWKVE